MKVSNIGIAVDYRTADLIKKDHSLVVGWVETICFDVGFRASTQPTSIGSM